MIRTLVWCTLEFEGWHKWDKAPNEVDYLRFPHRHIFKVQVFIEVKTNDREIEFITLKHQCQQIVSGFDKENVGSCEQIAEAIIAQVKQIYPNRAVGADVSEDGENGARVQDYGN